MDGDQIRLLRNLQAVISTRVVDASGDWGTPDRMIESLRNASSDALILVVDDFHSIANTAGEQLIERLVWEACPPLKVILASRCVPPFDLTRLRVSNELVEIGPDELRFRSWEVERLFRDVYDEPLLPEELAELSRRTEGWAAGLQLFHLVTQGRAPRQRQQFLAALGGRSLLVHEYLARNVLEILPTDVRDFLLATCVLERMTGPLCDRLLQVTGCHRMLARLEREHVFTYALDEIGTYRYHEVFRSYLEAALLEAVGEEAVRIRYRKAGILLEENGALGEALRAYCRAEEWEAAARLLGRTREFVQDPSTQWLDLVPPFMLNDDPWLLLASARRHRAAGRISAALAAYAEAESKFDTAKDRELCRRERRALVAWIDPMEVVPEGWLGMLREATTRDPLVVRRRAAGAEDPHERFVAGLSALLAGDLRDAASILEEVREAPDISRELCIVVRLALGIALLFSNEPRGRPEVERAAEEAEELRIIWLTRLSRAALSLDGRPDETSEALAARLAFERENDRWGSTLAALMHGWGLLRSGGAAVTTFEYAVEGAHRLGAGTVEAWARGGLALAMANNGDDGARLAAVQAEAFSRSAGVLAAQALAFRALSRIESSADFAVLAEQLETECGLVSPLPSLGGTQQSRLFPSIEIRCFGRFRIGFFGEEISLSGIKPRARAVLRMLALHGGQPVHREILQSALWPDATAAAAARILHVAISSLRHALDPHLPRSAPSLIHRYGDAYSLDLPPDAVLDVREFDRLVREAGLAEVLDDDGRAATLYRETLDLCDGELLPEDGPAEWVVDERERRSSNVCKVALSLARIHMKRGEPRAAAEACEAGLRHDRYRDELWRTRIAAYEAAGDVAAAVRTRQAYDRLLLDLGVEAGEDEPNDALRT